MSIPTAEETERLGALLEVLRAHGVTRYQADSLVLEMAPSALSVPDLPLAEQDRAHARALAKDPLFDAVDGPPDSLAEAAGLPTGRA